jgi:hypothetical protein
MTSSEWKNEMLVMVLTDLAAICKKLADNLVLPEELRVQARQFVAEFNFLLPFRGKGTASQLCAGEALLIRIARFLSRLIEVHVEPRSNVA